MAHFYFLLTVHLEHVWFFFVFFYSSIGAFTGVQNVTTVASSGFIWPQRQFTALVE